MGNPPATASPGAMIDAASIDAVLERLRWRVLDFADYSLVPGMTRADPGRGIRFHYVASGTVAISCAGGAIELRAGDFVLLARGDATLRADGPTRLVSGSLHLELESGVALGLMPAVLFACGFRTHEPAFASLLETLHREADGERAGRESVARRIADLVASAALRVWFERGCGDPRAWLIGLRDPNLGRAIDAMHADPGGRWTVEALARLARASRSQFAEQFRRSVGETPARYLTRLRMERAERMLRAGVSVTEAAAALGYDSDEGFSRAFRRHAGAPPSLWRATA
ncbi:AraC family transcriptional regulator [Agromyces intestinalis]|uniref:AraC family transcriptional regulator n=1 Tax=Agromyces intestinalis TaxID=2592652 RepID=A0A5C1YDX3_9MICO|nr:AraC family transcriptional regulator [Agromyces intestinalis]QEO14254.1 AraC family transcriptional regulator [Agromyces intestinalis]